MVQTVELRCSVNSDSVINQKIFLKSNRRAKYLRVGYDLKTHQFRLTRPSWAKQEDIDDFLNRAKPWLQQKVDNLKKTEVVSLKHGAVVPIFGKACRIHFQKDIKKSVNFHDEQITISRPHDEFVSLFANGIQKQALKVLTEKAFYYAKQLGVHIKKVSVKDTRSRWGSCTWDGKLSFSWRLMFAPLEVAEYVCAHEVAHLQHMDHSADFWKAVEKICPNYKKLRGWLREHGRQLFMYNFHEIQ